MCNNEEKLIIAPWVGPATSRNTLSVVVLSTNLDIIGNISKALRQVHTRGNFRWKLKILRSSQLEDVVNQFNLTGLVAMDFIILCVDTSSLFWSEWTKDVYNQIHPDLRCSRRVVLVNAAGLPVGSMAVNTEELISLRDDLNLNILTANVYNSDEATFLARQIFNLIEISLGIKTGIPNINI